MAFGTARLRYGEDLSWDELVKISQSHEGPSRVPVSLVSISEIGRFPTTPLPFLVTDEGPVVEPLEKEQYFSSSERLRNTIRERLSGAQKQEVTLYIHGFNNSLKDAIHGLNGVWHFSSRQGVPLVYSWPSGSGSPLGYFTDRESGEFTIHHLKETLRILAGMDELDRIHIIAHSRGTDIATTALRELVIEARAAGFSPRSKLKIENLIMAAPDLDYGVVKQRLIAEQFGPAFGQITIYMNDSDSALRLSQWLMDGIRFGRLTKSQQGAREDRIFQNVSNVNFIKVKDVSGLVGHGYFLKHKGVLSDIVQTLTTNARPGSPERPLTHIGSNFWELDKNYMKSGIKVVTEAPSLK